jgi:hypothetical protein
MSSSLSSIARYTRHWERNAHTILDRLSSKYKFQVLAVQKCKLLADVIAIRRKEELFKLLGVLQLDIDIFHT